MQPIVNQSSETDHNYSGLEPLLAERFWINYRLDKRKDGKLLKEPHNGSYSIDPHKPENHLSFLEAKRLMSSGFGIGFAGFGSTPSRQRVPRCLHATATAGRTLPTSCDAT